MGFGFLLLVLAGCGAVQEAPPVHFERSVLQVGGTPYALLAADVTRDGTPDLVTADQTGDRLVVFVGDGAGGFRQAVTVPAGPAPGGLASADFDEDGQADLAVANHETDHVTLLRGTGGGAFEPGPASPLVLGVAPHVHLVDAADLDEDGHADLVVDHREAGGLRLFPGHGDGTFGPGRTVEMGGDPYRGLAVVDLDGDGHLDLATPNERDAGVRLGRGDGSFGERRNVDVSPLAPFDLTAGDFDGDGRQDLGLAAGEGRSEATVLLGDGAGGFRPAPGGPYAVGSGAKSAAAADLDGDGAADLVVASWRSRELTIVFGGEGLGSGDAPRSHRVQVGENPWSVVTADFDGDGRPDIATADYGDGTLTILLNRTGTP